MSALLGVHEAHVAYGKVEAVRSVSLDIAEREIVTIIGANGAGKTTLLNAIMGILPLKGRIAFAGQDLSRLEIEDRVGLGLSLVPAMPSSASMRCFRGSRSGAGSSPARCPAANSRCWPWAAP